MLSDKGVFILYALTRHHGVILRVGGINDHPLAVDITLRILVDYAHERVPIRVQLYDVLFRRRHVQPAARRLAHAVLVLLAYRPRHGVVSVNEAVLASYILLSVNREYLGGKVHNVEAIYFIRLVYLSLVAEVVQHAYEQRIDVAGIAYGIYGIDAVSGVDYAYIASQARILAVAEAPVVHRIIKHIHGAHSDTAAGVYVEPLRLVVSAPHYRRRGIIQHER